MTFFNEVMARGPIGYWRLDEPSGSSAFDSSGNSHTLTYTNMTLNEPGLLVGDPNPGISTISNTSMVSATHATWMDTPAMTALVLCRPTSVSGFGNLCMVDDDSISTQLSWRFRRNGSTFDAFYRGAAFAPATPGGSIAVNTTYLAAYSTSAAGTQYIYLNGSLSSSVAGAAAPTAIGQFRIGRLLSTTESFIGGFGEVALFDYVLTAADHDVLYRSAFGLFTPTPIIRRPHRGLVIR